MTNDVLERRGSRKHRSQMTSAEIRAVETFVHGVPVNAWRFRGHAVATGLSRAVTESSALNALRLGDVFEAHCETGELRLGVRYDDGSPVSTCVIVAPKTREVITVYWNASNDTHATLLNWTLYRASFSVINMLA